MPYQNDTDEFAFTIGKLVGSLHNPVVRALLVDRYKIAASDLQILEITLKRVVEAFYPTLKKDIER